MRWSAEVSEEHADEGFGPGTDLVFSMLAVLIVMLAALRITALLISGDTDLSYIQHEKTAFIFELRKACAEPEHATSVKAGGTTHIVTSDCDLQVVDNPQFQTLIFNESVLFDFDRAELHDQGAFVLKHVRDALSARQRDIFEIQILGNADSIGDPDRNFHLGYERAYAVFNLLTEENGSSRIDPLGTLVSLTTYGFYNPVARRGRPEFSLARLNAANADKAQQALNRRIELNIFYRKSEGH